MVDLWLKRRNFHVVILFGRFDGLRAVQNLCVITLCQLVWFFGLSFIARVLKAAQKVIFSERISKFLST